jgi:hypothetical protein
MNPYALQRFEAVMEYLFILRSAAQYEIQYHGDHKLKEIDGMAIEYVMASMQKLRELAVV